MSIYAGLGFALGSWFRTWSWFGHGLGLGLDTVFIWGSKPSIQSGYVLGLGYSLSLGHSFYI
eukprot:884812-Ditylum_brightwellii.AAC.1